MHVPSEQLDAVRSLYDQGRLLDAYELANGIGPLTAWRGPRARVLAGRLAVHLGSVRLGYALHRFAHREHPDDPEAIYYHAYDLFGRQGPLATWQYLQSFGASTDHPDRTPDLPGAAEELAADWLALHGSILSTFRDFEPAERYLQLAMDRAPNKPWIWVERSGLYEREDKYPEALAAVRRALELQPWHRSAVHQVAHLLQLQDRDAEALEVLQEAAGHVQSAAILWQLATLQTELGRHEDARANWERVMELSPLADKHFIKGLAARRSDAAYYCGDIEEALRLSKESDSPFHKEVAKRLEENRGQGKRKVLSVPFVRQHYMTCAPATLSAVSRFWSMPAEHLSVAEEICYDGTPAHSERRWAGQAGYVAREFRVTWDSAVALIDRGIPFTLTTAEPTNAHLQAAIGYDTARGTLLIRDPFMRVFGEANAEPFLDRYKATGPRGMILVPQSKAHLLDGLELPEADLYDDSHNLQAALVEHRRSDAQSHYEALASKDQEHRLTLTARRTLAAYDGDPIAAMEAMDGLLKLYPDDPGLVFARVNLMRGLGKRDERIALLRTMVRKKECDPVFWTTLAAEMKDDARDHVEAMRLARKAVRYSRGDARNYLTLAGLLWDEQRRAEALQLYRFAAALEDKSDQLAHAYFAASRYLKLTGQVIRLLRDRFDRFGKKNATPAIVLFAAYEQIDQPKIAFKVLDEALALRPDDGELLLTAANAHARYGHYDQADALLARAKNQCRPAAWLRGAAEVATFRGEPDVARGLWQRVLEVEPLALDAHRHLALLLGQADGPAAAIAHLRAACERFPYNLPLGQAYLSWVADEAGPAAAEPELRHHLATHPTDTTVGRQLIYVLAMTQRLDEALAAADELIQIDPEDPANHVLRGKVLATAGRYADARASQRRAVSISVDADSAIADLIGCCKTLEQRKAELAFVRDELVRQTIFGDGLLAFRDAASDSMEPEELLRALQEALEARPDLWHAWAAVMRQLAETNRLPEAVQFGENAIEKFPLNPRVWIDLAHVYRLSNDLTAELAALEQALAVAPGWSEAVRELAEAFQRRGENERAKSMLEKAVARDPLDPLNQGWLAEVDWKLGNKEAALERAAKAVKLEPGYRWAWEALSRWSDEMGKPQAAVELARELTRTRAGESRSWMILARTLEPSSRQGADGDGQAPTSEVPPVPSPAEGSSGDVATMDDDAPPGLDVSKDAPPDTDATTPANGEALLNERLAALDQAISLNPRYTEAHDLRARLLCEAGKIDEARAASRPAAYGEHLPVDLQARAAWVDYEAGQHDEARQRMKQIVAEDPGYYPGWMRLLDWCRQANAKDDFIAATASMVRIWPHDVTVLCAYGDARLADQDRAAGKSAYARAVELDPDDLNAIYGLLDLQAEDNDLAAAEQTLALAQRLPPSPYTTARELDLLARQGERQRALAGLADLCVTEMLTEWPLRHAAGAIEQAGWDGDLRATLAAAAMQPGCHDWVGEGLVITLCKNGVSPLLESTLDRLIAEGPTPGKLSSPAAWAFRRALHELANDAQKQQDVPAHRVELGDLFAKLAGTKTRRVVQFIERRREVLRSEVGVWGTAGYAFQTVRLYPKVIEWLSDWMDRPEAEGWMLVNLAESLRATGRAPEAAPVNARGFEISQGNPRALHGLWLAADALLAGQPGEAVARLDQIKSELEQVQPQYQFFHALLEATLPMVNGPGRPRAFATFRKQVRMAVQKYPLFRREKELLWVNRECLKLVSRSGVGFGGRLWCTANR